MNSSKSGVHLYSWVRGLVYILRGCLDEGLSAFSAYFDFHTPSFDSFGALTHEFACHFFTALLVRLGNAGEATLHSFTRKGSSSGGCNNQGDTPLVGEQKVSIDSDKKEIGNELPLRYPDIAEQRLNALQQLSTYAHFLTIIWTLKPFCWILFLHCACFCIY